ncbi:hypothetical protein [Hyphomonas sp.]|uniref:hypothetical protein n=1 Tax=Hyphomonas sp. TaxID=87 RepID=UPI00391BB0DA
MERNIVKLFERREDAVSAVHELLKMGVDRDDVSILSSDEGLAREQTARDPAYAGGDDNHAGDGAATGASTGAFLGGGAGLLAGLGLLAIPGLGPVVAAGWLASMLTGAVAGAAVGGATGGVIGALVQSGVPEDEAHVYSEGINRGGTLVSVRNTGMRMADIEAVLDGFGTSNVTDAGARYRASGWSAPNDI